MLSLSCKEWFKITGRGWIATMETTQEERDQLKLQEPVSIDGHEYIVTGFEKHSNSFGVKANIGILVRGERKDL